MSYATPAAVLRTLGIDYVERTNRLMFRCPFHHDTDPSAGFYLDTGLCHCFSCSYTLDCTTFYAKYREIPRAEAERELTRLFGGTAPPRKVDRLRIARERALGEQCLRDVRSIFGIKDHAYLGEQLDRILLLFERGHLSESEVDTNLQIWYNDIEEGIHAGSISRRAPRTRAHGRVTNGMGEVPGAGPENGAVDLD